MLALGTYTGLLESEVTASQWAGRGKQQYVNQRQVLHWSPSLMCSGDVSCVRDPPIAQGVQGEQYSPIKGGVQCSEGCLRTPKFKQSRVFTNLIEAKSYHSCYVECNVVLAICDTMWVPLLKTRRFVKLERGSKNCYQTQMKSQLNSQLKADR